MERIFSWDPSVLHVHQFYRISTTFWFAPIPSFRLLFLRFQPFFLVPSCLKTRTKALNRLRLSDCLNKHASCTARPFALTSSWVNVIDIQVVILKHCCIRIIRDPLGLFLDKKCSVSVHRVAFVVSVFPGRV